MISHLCCIRIHTIYTKWSYISRPYLLCTKQKGVQALRLRLGKWMAPLSSCIFNPLTPSRGNTKKVAPDTNQGKQNETKSIGCVTPSGTQSVADGTKHADGHPAPVREQEDRPGL